MCDVSCWIRMCDISCWIITHTHMRDTHTYVWDKCVTRTHMCSYVWYVVLNKCVWYLLLDHHAHTYNYAWHTHICVTYMWYAWHTHICVTYMWLIHICIHMCDMLCWISMCDILCWIITHTHMRVITHTHMCDTSTHMCSYVWYVVLNKCVWYLLLDHHAHTYVWHILICVTYTRMCLYVCKVVLNKYFGTYIVGSSHTRICVTHTHICDMYTHVFISVICRVE